MITSSAITAPVDAGDETMWKLIADGDLSRLTPDQKSKYYLHLCNSMKLNPATQPFRYLKLGGREVLYAQKGATDQLRGIHGVSFTNVESETNGGILTVTVYAQDKTGRTDVDFGAVPVQGLQGENLANAHMKAITKAKRRVTLSICGLGFLDESEVDSIPGARPAPVTPMRLPENEARIYNQQTDHPTPSKPEPPPAKGIVQEAEVRDIKELKQALWDKATEVFGDFEIDEGTGEPNVTKDGAGATIAALQTLATVEHQTDTKSLTAKQIDNLMAILGNPENAREYVSRMQDDADFDVTAIAASESLRDWVDKVSTTPVKDWPSLWDEAFSGNVDFVEQMVMLAPTIPAIKLVESEAQRRNLLVGGLPGFITTEIANRNRQTREQLTKRSA